MLQPVVVTGFGTVVHCVPQPQECCPQDPNKEGGTMGCPSGGRVSLQHCVLAGPVSLQDPSMC